jgi:hypothetical protein
LRPLLLPVVRFCVRHAIKLHDIVEALKPLLLEVATQELERSGVKPTSNKLSLMTGVHRKDVTRLDPEAPAVEKRADIVTRIIGQWQSDRRFRTAGGKAKVLSFEGGKGEFAKLVASVSREVSPYAVAAEMQRSGVAGQTTQGMKLLAAVYVPRGNLDESFSFLGQDMEDLIVAVEENTLTEADPPNHHITTEYNNIRKSSIAAIREWFLREGEGFHRRAREFLSQHDRDINPKAGQSLERYRVSVSSFSRVENLTLEKKEPHE